jgi:ATP-dependent 26S proteasome regulatory subunit
MVRDVFRLAKENAPAIIFIDEVDAIATARFDAQTGADREVQRILMELLNQVWFFKKKLNNKGGIVNFKVIGIWRIQAYIRLAWNSIGISLFWV